MSVKYLTFLKPKIVSSVCFGIGQVGAFDSTFDDSALLIDNDARASTSPEIDQYLEDQVQLALPHGRLGSLPPGGADGEILAKRSDNDFDTEWIPNTGGGSDEYDEYANVAAFPVTGATEVIYLAQDTNILYRWNGSGYEIISPIPGKADGTDVDVGTDDAKYVTPKALEDSDYIKEADLPPSGGASNFYKGADYATFGDGLPSYTYDNGASGVGATITADGNGALDIYGDNPSNGDRVVVLGNATQIENGIYDVTEAGDGSNPFILTRADDFNLSSQIIKGASVVIAPNTNGRLAGTILYVSTQGSPAIGSNDINFTSIRVEAQVETIQAGSGISVDDTDPANPVVSLGAVPNYTFATLPGSPTMGDLAIVTDSTETAWGRTPDDSGANAVLCWFDGSNWSIFGTVGA